MPSTYRYDSISVVSSKAQGKGSFIVYFVLEQASKSSQYYKVVNRPYTEIAKPANRISDAKLPPIPNTIPPSTVASTTVQLHANPQQIPQANLLDVVTNVFVVVQTGIRHVGLSGQH